jgi:AAA domain
MTLLQTMTAAELARQDFDDLHWAVEGLIPEGLTILAGSPKVGKSWLGLDLALSVATGRKALGTIPVNQSEVLYLALEDSPRRLLDRLDLIVEDELLPETLHFATQVPEVGAAAIEALLTDFVTDYPGVRFIVIDTFGRVRRAGSASADAYQADTDFAGRLQSWALRYHVALVVIHHDRKVGGTDWLENVSGTFGITGAADTVLLLSRNRDEQTAELRLTGRDVRDDRAWSLYRHGTHPKWLCSRELDPTVEAAKSALGNESREIVDFIVSSGQVSAKQVIDAFVPDPSDQRGRERVGRALRYLAKTGRVTKRGRGLYGGVSGVSAFTASEPFLAQTETPDKAETPLYDIWAQ